MARSWADTEIALQSINKMLVVLHAAKPPRDDPSEKYWQVPLEALRALAVELHYERIAICISNAKKGRK